MSRSILVIDDSITVLAATERVMAAHGWEVRTLAQPLLLADTLRGWKPDAVLLDVEMPALSGPKLLEIARSKSMLTGIPVILYSSKTEEELRELARSCGAAGWIEKSGGIAALPVRITKVLGEAGHQTRAPNRDVEPAAIRTGHEALAAQTDELRRAIGGGNPGPATFRTLVACRTHCDDHFREEEALAKLSAFPKWAAHAREHERFRADVELLLTRFRGGETGREVGPELLGILDDHLVRHAAQFDRPLLRHFAADGSSGPPRPFDPDETTTRGKR